jgi:hypothetical protein
LASLANSVEEVNLALALSFSQVSSDDFDEQIAQLPPEESAPVNLIFRPRAPTSNEKNNLALALILSPPCPEGLDNPDEQAPLASLLMAMSPEEIRHHIDTLSNH